MPLLTAGIFLQAHAVATYTLSRQIVYKEKRSNENKGRTMNDCTESYEESHTFNPESNEKERTAARRREHNGFPLASFAHADIRPSAPDMIEGVIFDLDGTLLDTLPALVGEPWRKLPDFAREDARARHTPPLQETHA